MLIKENILPLTSVIVLIALIIFLSFYITPPNDKDLQKLTVTGNELISSIDYLEFAEIESEEKIKGMGTTLIFDRMSKHPFIKKLNIEERFDNVTEINIKEKKIEAIIVKEEDIFFVTERLELIQKGEFKVRGDYPVITINKNIENKSFKTIALYLIKSLFIVADSNKKLEKEISEFYVDEFGNYTIFLSESGYTVKLGKDNIVEKVVYFSTIWKKITAGKISENVDYVDLRYKNKIYIGFKA